MVVVSNMILRCLRMVYVSRHTWLRPEPRHHPFFGSGQWPFIAILAQWAVAHMVSRGLFGLLANSLPALYWIGLDGKVLDQFMLTPFATTFGPRAGLGPARDLSVNSDNNTRKVFQNDNQALEGELYDIQIQHEVVHHRSRIDVRGLPRTVQNTLKANDTLQSYTHLPRHLSSKPRHAAESHLKRTHNKWHA